MKDEKNLLPEGWEGIRDQGQAVVINRTTKCSVGLYESHRSLWSWWCWGSQKNHQGGAFSTMLEAVAAADAAYAAGALVHDETEGSDDV